MLELLLFAAETHDAAEEGQKVITAMLLTGLIFVAVIVIGDGLKYLRHRRRRPKRDGINDWQTVR
ncbi:MAG TPA: hypothetical protein VE444_10960 [Gaiellaceae bacterium]|jgi:hypothetical protein|nr:hypothetical protein [Gaiellaceae bacterium]